MTTLKVWPQTWSALQPFVLAAKECSAPPAIMECPRDPMDCSCSSLEEIRGYTHDSANGCSEGMQSAVDGMIDGAISKKDCKGSRLAMTTLKVWPQTFGLLLDCLDC